MIRLKVYTEFQAAQIITNAQTHTHGGTEAEHQRQRGSRWHRGHMGASVKFRCECITEENEDSVRQ